MSIETRLSRESGTVFNDGDQIDTHASTSPNVISFKTLKEEARRAEQQKNAERVLLPHEVVAQFGDYLEDFRLWESELGGSSRKPL